MRVCSVCSRCFPDAEVACVETQHPSLTDLRDRTVDMVDGYRVDRLIATSPYVEKYLARQSETDVECVIAVVPLGDADSQRFLKDAKTASSLFHPSIADIYGSGLLQTGEAYYISETSRSRSLRDILNDGLPPLLTTIEIIRETAEALHAMNSNGLVHGAVRPENIVVSDDPLVEHRVKLHDPDFGGATRRSIISNKLTIDAACDAIKYFAPEQFSADDAAAQADVYALGTLLFEMLAGEPPFSGESAAELIEKIRNEHPPDIKINNFDLRMLLTHTLMQSLQKQPAFRQPTALAFARQLRHMEQLATHSATPPVPAPGAIPQKRAAAAGVSQSTTQPTTREMKRHKTIEITDVKKLDLRPAERPQASKAIGVERTGVNAAPAPVTQDQLQKETTGDLNRSRLRSWKEKYHAASSALRSDSKSGLRQLSILEPKSENEPKVVVQENKVQPLAPVEVSKPTRIKIEWNQSNEDIPSLDEVLKVQAEEAIPAAEPAPAIAQPSERKPPVGNDLFGSFAKRPRVKKRAKTVAEAGMLSAIAPRTGIAMDRRIIAGALAAAVVIVGLFFASTIFDRGEARSAAAGSPETEIILPAKSEPARQVSDEVKIETSEPDMSLYNLADSEPKKEAATPSRPKPSDIKDPVRDVVQDPPRKSSITAPVATQLANKPAPAKTTPKATLTPSTLVITPGNGKVKSKVEPGSGSAFTRARIVANPKP